MAKKRKIVEVVSDTAPKTKEKSLSQSAREQNDFNDKNRYVDERSYKSTSDPDPLGRDNAESLEPGFGQKKIADKDNFTSRSARKMDPVYNYGMGLSQNKVAARKGLGDTLSANKNQPTLDNTNATGLDGELDRSSLSVSNEPAKKPVDPNTVLGNQGSALVNATKPSGKMEPMDTRKPEKVSLTIADQKASKPVDPNTTLGNQGKGIYDVSNEPAKQPVDPEVVLGNQGQKLIETISSDLNNTFSDKAILAQIQNAESPEEIERIKADAQAAKEIEQKEKSALVNENSNLIKQFMGAINEKMQSVRPRFDQIGTIQDVEKGILNQYRNQASNVPYAVVEKLGIQDYYPNAGRDIAVGTFSGSRIGSQTIYSGAGALLPMGLYDARKRSLLEAAKTKQKKIDEFLQVPDAPDQFNSDFQQAAYSNLYDIGAKHNWDMNAIMKDKEAMQRVYSIKNSAKELAYTDEIVNNIFETLNTAEGKTASYVPEDILEAMIDYRKGKLDVEAVLSGDNNVLELAGKIRNYANSTAWADKNLPEWKSDPTSLPLNLKKDKEITMESLNEINQAIEKAKTSGDYDSYITAVKKFYHLDPKVVDAWVDQNMVGATPEQKQKVVNDLNDYIFAQMPPESIEMTVKDLSNKNYEYWAKSQDLKRYDKERETIMTRAINTAKNAKLKDKISAINNDASLNTPEKKAAALSKAYRDAGMTPNYNKTTGEVYGVVKYTAADKKMNVIYPANTTQVWVQKSDKKGGGMAWVNISTVLANQSDYKLSTDQKSELTQFQKGGARGSINESRMYETYVDDKGYIRKVGTNNIDKYSSTTKERKGLGTEAVGNVVILSKDKEGNVIYKPGTMQIRAQFNPETNPTDRDALDAMFATEKQKLSTDTGFDAAGPSTNL